MAGSRNRVEASKLVKSDANQSHELSKACHAPFPSSATTILAWELVEKGWIVIWSKRPAAANSALLLNFEQDGLHRMRTLFRDLLAFKEVITSGIIELCKAERDS